VINECHVMCQIRARDDVFLSALRLLLPVCSRPAVHLSRGESPSHMAVIGVLLKLLR
jgi:hypothetical protein